MAALRMKLFDSLKNYLLLGLMTIGREGMSDAFSAQERSTSTDTVFPPNMKLKLPLNHFEHLMLLNK